MQKNILESFVGPSRTQNFGLTAKKVNWKHDTLHVSLINPTKINCSVNNLEQIE